MGNDTFIYIQVQTDKGKRFLTSDNKLVTEPTSACLHRVGRVPMKGESISIFEDWYGEKGGRKRTMSWLVEGVEFPLWDLGNRLADEAAIVSVFR